MSSGGRQEVPRILLSRPQAAPLSSMHGGSSSQAPARTACSPWAPRTLPPAHVALQPLQRVPELADAVVGAVRGALQVHVGHPHHLRAWRTVNTARVGNQREGRSPAAAGRQGAIAGRASQRQQPAQSARLRGWRAHLALRGARGFAAQRRQQRAAALLAPQQLQLLLWGSAGTASGWRAPACQHCLPAAPRLLLPPCSRLPPHAPCNPAGHRAADTPGSSGNRRQQGENPRQAWAAPGDKTGPA